MFESESRKMLFHTESGGKNLSKNKNIAPTLFHKKDEYVIISFYLEMMMNLIFDIYVSSTTRTQKRCFEVYHHLMGFKFSVVPEMRNNFSRKLELKSES